MHDDVLYTPEEIAQKLKISKYTVYEMIKRGDINAHRIGRNLRISSAQLEMYMLSTKELNNVYHAIILKENDETYAQVDSVKMYVSTDLTGDVRISIDPSNIILCSEIFPNSARNAQKGIVTKITEEDMGINVFLDIGIPLVAKITKQSLESLGIKKGTKLYAIFKTMAVKVFK